MHLRGAARLHLHHGRHGGDGDEADQAGGQDPQEGRQRQRGSVYEGEC